MVALRVFAFSIFYLFALFTALTICLYSIVDGIGGRTADVVGQKLRALGSAFQVLCITHLPQIASKGSHHLFVYKKDEEDKTISYIRELKGEERVTEIAKMLSTGKPSASALVNAKELLNMN